MPALGLQNSFRERVYEPLQRYRNSDSGGKEISFQDFLQTRAVNSDGKPAGLMHADGKKATWEDIFCEFGKDPGSLTLDNILSSSGDMKYLAPEIIRQFILEGMNTTSTYTDLIAGTETVDQMVITTPWAKMLDEAPEGTGEAETISEAGLTWGSKSVSIKKKAKAIKITDELLLTCKIPILGYFLRRFGVALAAGLYVEAVNNLINGDQADGSDSAAVIGTDASGKIEYGDYLNVWIRGSRIFAKYDNMICNEVGTKATLSLPEFKAQQYSGAALVNLKPKNGIVPSQMPFFVANAVGDGQRLLFDKPQAQIMLVFRPLLVESERIIMRQINGTACSIIAGFASLFRWAKIIIDDSQSFATKGFPDYMTPLV